LIVQDKVGNTFVFNPMICNKLSVYALERNELAIGDKVRITRNDAKLDIANGDRFTVVDVEQDKITFESQERRIELSTNKPLHLDYAYATTVHSAQGLTSKQILIDIDTKSLTTSKEVYYVAISRAKEAALIFADKTANLNKAIEKDNHKFMSLEIK